MLTIDDKTIVNAIEVFEEIKDTGVKNFGFKDIGLPFEKLKVLAKNIKECGHKIFFEIVSATEEETITSVNRAIELNVDYIIGGKYVDIVQKEIEGHKVEYFPYAGEIVGHPCLLEGSINEIVSETQKYIEKGVGGINILAYRYNQNPEELISALRKNITKPIIIAGSVNSEQRVNFLKSNQIDFFTVGTAIFEKDFVKDGSYSQQIEKLLSFLN